MKRMLQFLEDNDERLSMVRLITLGAFLISSITFLKTPSVEFAAVYLGVWGALGMNSKWQEMRPEIAKAASGPSVTVNQEKATNVVSSAQ